MQTSRTFRNKNTIKIKVRISKKIKINIKYIKQLFRKEEQ